MVDVTTPKTYDFTWVRGTNVPVRFTLSRNGVPISFDDARLTVSKGKDLLFRLSVVDGGGEVTNPATGEVTFTPTTEQTRLLVETSLGKPGKNNYELEYRDGTSEQVYLIGTITGLGGRNDDEVEDVS
jgi:hypothetical protein